MYDIIFIGGGLNYAGAVVAAKRGLHVALIEQDLEHIGGTCLNNGCIPSKHFLHLAKAQLKLHNPAFSRHKDRLKLDIAVQEKDEVIHKAHRAIEKQCLQAGVEIIEGKGYITGAHTVEVNGTTLKAQYIIIGTGSHPFIPEGITYNQETIITSDEALNLKTFPSSIAIYGSGAIGLEMAGFFAANEVATTLIYRHEHISNKIHPTIVQSMEKTLQDTGVQLMPNTTIVEAKEQEKRAKVTTNNGIYEFDKLLVATGRIPNTDVIKTSHIAIDRGIVTDDYFTTTLANVYAIGDCNAKLMLAHAARAQVLNVVDTILGKKRNLNLTHIPKFIYTLPSQYAAVGLTKKDNPAKEALFPLSALALSHLAGGDEGYVILYADHEDFLVGAEIYSPNAEEIISAITVGLVAELDSKTALQTVFPHPTYSEAIDRALRRL